MAGQEQTIEEITYATVESWPLTHISKQTDITQQNIQDSCRIYIIQFTLLHGSY